MRIRMYKTCNFVPPYDKARRVTIQYLGGRGYTVKREWGETMVAKGYGFEVVAPPRPRPPVETQLPRRRRAAVNSPDSPA